MSTREKAVTLIEQSLSEWRGTPRDHAEKLADSILSLVEGTEPDGWIVAWKTPGANWTEAHNVGTAHNRESAESWADEYREMGRDARVQPFRYTHTEARDGD